MSAVGYVHRFLHFAQYKWRFLVLCTVATVLSATSTVYFFRFLARPTIGLVSNFPEVTYEDGRVIFAPKTPFSPAVASGLKPKQDVIVRVGGREIRGTWDVVIAEYSVRSFDEVAVDVIRNGNPQTIYVQPVLNLARIDWLFILVFSVALGFTVFVLTVKRADDAASNYMALAALFYLVFTCVKPFYYETAILGQ